MTAPAKPVGYLQLLRQNPNFRILWSGQIVSLLGDWFNLIASASLIAALTQSGAAVGGLFVVRMLAPFIVSPVAGVFADRYNRKHLLIITDIVRAITVIGFLFIRSPEWVWLIYVLTAIQMAGQGFFFPARNSILPDLTTDDELGAANALSSVTWSVMLAFGAALGGIFAGIWGVYPAFVLDAITFIVSALILSQLDYTPPVALGDSDKSVMAGVRQYLDGLSYLRHHLDILVIAIQKMSNALFIAGAFEVLQVLIAEEYFPIGEGGGISLGIMYGVAGVGTGIGPIIARMFSKDRDLQIRYTMMFGYIVSIIGLLTIASLANFPVVLLGVFLRGLGGGVVWVMSTQLLLQLVPLDVRGRVFSTEFAFNTLGAAIGAGSVGTILDTSLTLPNLLVIMAGLVIIPFGLWTYWTFFGTREKAKATQNA
ncbi:MAG: MFS transporter [Phototrophicaceae bacterium]